MDKIEYTVTEFHGPDAKCRGTLADLILDARIIPPCGLIPPFRVVAAVLRSGGADAGMSPGCIWEPFDLKENDYWQAVERLEGLNSDDLKNRHRNAGISGEIRPDYSAPDTADYIVWLDSLAQRGFAS